ncbi:M24 family metallopeptidase [Halalkalibacter oceani]|uniref:Xaa-Pro peptidase family protein n=1 Tax=Halalkalibacter oceani TaxID=1653776 RepID=A0A9X2DTK6_9BACI|nr:Xaa-Pro peptidase family protein [Halalkalibacter oceani]MCM3715257.1 Xaa-Pro peptidase family protein [Halalkalibacter oceani]
MDRLTKLREQFTTYNIDGLLITSSYNRRYMARFTGTAGVVLIAAKEAVFITDFRYVEQAKEQAAGFTIVQHTGPIYEEVARQVERLGITKLGFEQAQLTYEAHSIYNNVIKTAELVPVGGLVEDIRLKKDDEEVKIIQEAADIADAAFAHITTFIRPGVTELEVANELEFFMRKQGAQSSSFDIIVASGYRSALPHGVASEKVIQTGELVTLDFGAYYKGYCSDITRTVAVGQISEELHTIYHTVLEAQLRGMAGIKAGMTGKEADALTRDYITEKGYGEYFGHSTGHGLGLEIHEGPTLSMRSETVLEPGMIVTVEPGIYIAGVGGTRIEDDILITEDGNSTFTHSPKELLVIGG